MVYCPLFLTSTDVFKGSELKLAPEWGAPLIEGLVGEAVWETDQRSPGKNPNQLFQTLHEIPPSSVFMVETSRRAHSACHILIRSKSNKNFDDKSVVASSGCS